MKERKMELKTIILSLEVSMILSLAHGLHCNEKEYATFGQDVVIDCQLGFVSDVYWYSEKTSFDSPLVKIENEQKVILEAGKGNYDISETGALLIKDVVKERCGFYKLLSFDKDGIYEEAFVLLELLNKPRKECLVVSLCDSCYCSSDAKTNHNVSCSVLGARPQVKVSLITENEDLFNVTIRHNTDTDTFDTIAYMEVSIDTCGSKLSVRCTVVGSNIFGIKDSSMDLNSAPCIQSTDTLTDATATDEEESVVDGFRLVIVVIVVTVVVICMVLVVCLTVRRKGRNDNSKKEYQERDIGLNITEPLLTHSSYLAEGEMEKLIKHLQDRYQSMSYIKPLPWGEKVLIDELYTETICNVTYPNKPRETKTSKSLLDPTISQQIKRALFIADIGHGKTTLRQYLACEWSKKELKEQKIEMLFILPLTGIDINAGIGEQLHKTLPGKMNISRKQLCDIILKRKCHLLLDGLDEINQQEKTSSKHVVSTGDISIKRLLNESMLNQYPHLRLWVTSRKIDQSKCIYGKPYVEVEILGFNVDGIKTYVRKTLDYYKRLKPCEKEIIHKGDFNDSSDVSINEETNEENDAEIIEKTISTLDQNDLLQIFKDTPLFIVMLIHIIMSKLLQINGAINELNMNKMSSLVNSIITCLDRRFLERHGKEIMSRKLQPLRMKLAKASLNYEIDIGESIKNFDLNEARLQAHEIEMAQSVGYIKPIKALQRVGMSKSHYNVFSHNYIQEFCIAEYIVSKDLDSLQKILRALKANKIDENIRSSRMLRFFCGICTTTNREEALKFLLASGCWNTLIDCMFESENFEDIIAMDFIPESVKPSTLLQNYTSHLNMKVVRLDERYHQNAFKLCMGLCLRSNLHFDSISIGAECPLDFLLSLTLPMVDTFELRNISCVNKESNTFLKIIFWAMKTNVNNRIRFLKGYVPAKVESKYMKESPFKIAYNADGNDRGSDYILDLGSGTWKKPTITAVTIGQFFFSC